MKCHKTTVKRWLNRWTQTKDLSNLQKKGRSRVTTSEEDQMIVELVQEDMDEGITSEDIQQELRRQGTNISRSTIQNRLLEAGFKFSRPLSKPLLTQQHRRNRLIWAQSMQNYNWNKLIISNETTIRLHAVGKFFWQRPGERKVVRTVKYPLKVNVWGCLSNSGFGRIVCFQHNLTSDFLCNEIYQNALLPTARSHFGRRHDWVLLEDNDPKHRSRFSIQWKREHHITTLPWPSHSPDANPIENLWPLIKTKVSNQKPKTIKNLTRAIYKEWNDLPPELASKLVWSMKNRVHDLIESESEYILY
ncbi:unnamed protein product [Rotaria sordida]|uniref:Transposase n=2 Tax=Rotaria sordida TaxID=392033 RepID=A0A813XJ61_9BILA|nr:unnamed protein product [Rotaria sordida]CAF0862741.1 unnamed protein product [Rotaria sordida]CAF0870717.1 unnamed protein product [Rotaria sordida]